MGRHTFSRREFVGVTGAGVALATGGVWGWAAAAVAPRDADLVVLNARVYTVDAQTPRAEAFAIKNGRFMAVGSSAEIKALAGKNTQILDAQQITVVPGFIDCHNHAPGNTCSTRSWSAIPMKSSS